MDKKISELDVNPSITGAEEVPTERNSSNYKNTYDSLKTWVLSGLDVGVETVTGDGVDNTDPLNPVITANSGVSNVYESNTITFTNVIGDYFGKKETPRTGTLVLDSAGAVTGASSIVYYNNFDLDLSENVSFQSGSFVSNEINYLRFVRDADGFYSLTILNIKQLEYFLSLTSAEKDYILIDKGDFDVNSLVGTGSYYFEVKFRLKTITGSNQGGFGNVASTNIGNNKLGFLFSNGNIDVFSGGSFTIFTGFQSFFLNEIITFRLAFTENGANTTVRFLINGEESRLASTHANLGVGSDVFAWMNALGTSNDTGAAGTTADVDLFHFDLNGKIFNINEGSGFDLLDTSNGHALGVTNRVGGVADWNSEVWKIEDNGEGVSIFDKVYMFNSVNYSDGTRSAFSEYEFNTDSEYLRVKFDNSLRSLFPNYATISVYVDGVLQEVKEINVSTVYYRVELPAGNKNIKLVETVLTRQSLPSKGTFITDIKIDNTVFTQVTEQPTSDKISFIGDSITMGDGSTTPEQEAFTRLFNIENAHNVAVLGWGFGKLQDFASTPTLLADFNNYVVQSMSNVTANKKFVIALGTNDYGLSSTPAATFETWYADLVDEIISIDNTIEIFCISPLFRTGETTLLQDYRDSISTICGTRSECTYIDGLPILVVGDLADGLHPTTAGHKKYKDSIYGTITF